MNFYALSTCHSCLHIGSWSIVNVKQSNALHPQAKVTLSPQPQYFCFSEWSHPLPVSFLLSYLCWHQYFGSWEICVAKDYIILKSHLSSQLADFPNLSARSSPSQIYNFTTYLKAIPQRHAEAMQRNHIEVMQREAELMYLCAEP